MLLWSLLTTNTHPHRVQSVVTQRDLLMRAIHTAYVSGKQQAAAAAVNRKEPNNLEEALGDSHGQGGHVCVLSMYACVNGRCMK
jgi:hypothetical protein